MTRPGIQLQFTTFPKYLVVVCGTIKPGCQDALAPCCIQSHISHQAGRAYQDRSLLHVPVLAEGWHSDRVQV
jgi:hypothetical protein